MGNFRYKIDLQNFAAGDGTDILNRTGSQALIPEDVASEILAGVTENSFIMRMGRRLPDMATNQRRLPVLNTLPRAYFVNGDTGMKQTTRVDWSNKFLDVEELATIVPIPEAVLDDAGYDIWGQVRPLIEQAMGLAFDQAVLYGLNKPAAWPNGLVPDAVARGNVVALGTGSDLYDDVMGEDGVIAAVERDGFLVTGHMAAIPMRGRLRGLRDANGQPIFVRSMQEGAPYQLDGEPIYFPRSGAVDPTQGLMVSGDYDQLVYAMRQDITYKLLTEAVIQDPVTREIVYNLAQQDMVALRAVMRLAWQIPNPINNVNTDSNTRYPFAVLRQPAPAPAV